MQKALIFDQWRSQPKILGGQKFGEDKMFDFRRITLFCLEKHLSKHTMSIFSKNLGGHDPFAPPGYAYVFDLHDFKYFVSVLS